MGEIDKVCNICGTVLDPIDLAQGYNISGVLGYGSKHDGMMFSINICTECMDYLIEESHISPLVGDKKWLFHLLESE